MPESHRRPGRRTAAAVFVVVLALLAAALPAQAAAIQAGRARYAAAIEPLAGYQPQTMCSPTAKPGVADFSRRLLKAFPSTRSLGIVRACSAGGRSEHKEGRAFDWGVSARSAADRARVARVVAWLTRPDVYGNRFAMARRLGIQYVIWNHKIWGTYAATSGWRRYTGANPHTDHVHFSFTWAGARRATSFWTGKVGNVVAAPLPTTPAPRVPVPPGTPAKPGTPPAPPAPPRSQPRPADALPPGPELVDETLDLPGSAAGAVTSGALVAGQDYLIEASGTWQYGRNAGMLADAECSRTATDATWRRDRSVHELDPTSDHLDLYVDGTDLLSDPDTDTGGQCDTASHTYRYVYRPWRSGRVTFQSWDPTPLSDNSGALSIRILRSAPVEDVTFAVPAGAAAGVTSPGALSAGQTYLVTVSGTVDAGAGVTADAECSSTPSDPVWRRERAADPAYPGVERLDVLLDKSAVAFDPVTDADGSRCDASNHSYRFTLTPRTTRPVNLRVDDLYRGDDAGAFTARITRVVQPSGPETVTVSSTAAADATTARTYLAGKPVKLTATGTYTYAAGTTSDARCSATTADPTWRSNRLLDAGGNQLGDATVNGRVPSWRTASGAACDSTTHTYTYTYTPTVTGPLSLGVADLTRGDNAGSLTVTVEPVA
ncbi:MAG: hypothetical protein QOI54_3 [Actinomycetota bacterium]|nr:hypothetical protein [Actinomycetota bacterium]